MNLAIRGAEGNTRWGDSYHDDKFFDLRADHVVSNPPFNDSEWGADRVKPEDPRFKYGVPPIATLTSCGFSIISIISHQMEKQDL